MMGRFRCPRIFLHCRATGSHQHAARPLTPLSAAAIFLLSACATYNGVAEFTIYEDAYRSAAAAGEDILDRMAVAERKLYDIANPFDPLLTDFDPAAAGLVSDATDPPAAAAYRGALRAITSYNQALLGLASGKTAEEIAAKIAQLGAVGSAAAADIAGIAGRSPGTVAAVAAVNTIIAGFQPLAAKLLAFRTRDEFRTELIANADLIRNAIHEARASTSQVYGVLRDAVIATAMADPNRTGQLTEAEVEQIKDYRRLLASWVVLLDASLDSFEIAIAAAQSDGAISLDGLLLASQDLAAAVRAARVGLADDD
jgi:hypothetical protein